MKKIIIVLTVGSFVLIALGVFFNFLIYPVYTKYRLSGCLDRIDAVYDKLWSAECATQNTVYLNSCLRKAQEKVYCKDPSHKVISKSFWGNADTHTCSVNNTPDNSGGYWNNNLEYQQLAKECEQDQKGLGVSCELPSDLAESLNNLRDKERNFCLRQF